jgi:isopentenyldiphosphate isomerase
MAAQHTEAWQVFDTNGSPVEGTSILPVESRKSKDVIVGAVHVWIWRKTSEGTIEILLQHRAVDKPTWPDYLDISVAGHIDAGESLTDAILREADEEVGAKLDVAALEFIFSYRNFENGIKWVYLLEETVPTSYTFNDGEVQALQWVTLEDFDKMTHAPELYKLVPHPEEYYALLTKALHILTA